MIKVSLLKLFILLNFLFSNISYSQDNLDLDKYLTWYDKQLGIENTHLLNGKQYFDKDKIVLYENKHAYFLTDKFFKGTVDYNDQIYTDIKLQYNLELDALIINLNINEKSLVLKLIKSNIQSFTIDQRKFLNVNSLSDKNTLSDPGFMELLYTKNDIFLLKKYEKSRRTKIKQSGRRRHSFVYFMEKTKYFVLKERIVYKADSKSELLDAFPRYKEEIKSFYKLNWKLKQKYPDIFMKNLFEKVIVLNPVE